MVLDVRGLTVRYPGAALDALRDISLAVEPGSFVTVAGRNGAGKSTLCLAAAGLLPRVVRATVRGSAVVAGHAGLVLSDPAAGLTGARASVREEVAFGLENLGVPRADMDRRIDGALAALGIEHLADRAPESLSGGEQQRVAIAAARAMDSPLLVLDEATAELDPAGASALAELLAGMAAGGRGVLAADHAAALLSRSDRTVVLEGGEVAAICPPATALEHPALEGPADPGVGGAAAWPAVAHASAREVRAPAVAVRGLTYRYPNGVEALRDVTLDIPPGQAMAIVGENGSGKSTLARHLMRLLRPTSGSVTIDGRDVARSTPQALARRIGSVFQDPREQLFGRTIRQAVAFGPKNLGFATAECEALVSAALAATGLVGREATNPHDLDVAARKQVALAGALALDPGLLLLDEPTTGQDRPGLARVEAVLRGLHAAGRTVIAITHDLDLARRAFDRVVTLRGGEVVGDRRGEAPR